jgi:hypothetical protein
MEEKKEEGMKKRIFIIVCILTGAFCLGAQAQEPYMLLLGKNVTVLDAPDGNKIGQLYESTMIKVIEEKDGSLKVQIEGWIKKQGAASTKKSDADADPNKDLKQKGRDVIEMMENHGM